MTVKELKEQLAKMNDSDEVSANLPIGLFLSGEELKRKRVYMVCDFPEEGLPISDFFDDDEELIEFFKDKDILGGSNVNKAVCELMEDCDCFCDLPFDYVHFEVR